MSDQPVFLVDGTSQLFRAFHALPPMTNTEGLPTNAVFGFVSMLRKLMTDQGPSTIGVAFDKPGRVFRHDTFKEYKANRPPAPEEIKVQVPYVKQACEVLGVPFVELDGFEADDLIASYTRLAREAGHEVVIVGSDKDLLQLVGDGVRVFNPTKEIWLDEQGVEQSFGVPPERVLDAQALMGDSVDNIPGVPGVGKKTALTIVSTYGDVENSIARAQHFVSVYDARDRLLASMDVLDKETPATTSTVDALNEAAQALAAALTEWTDNEVDAEMRDRGVALSERLATFDFEAVRSAVGQSGRAAAKPIKPLKKDLKAMDRGSSKKVWYSIAENVEQARLSKELATLRADVPVPVQLTDLSLRDVDRAQAATFFRELGFKALIAEYEADAPPEAVSDVGEDAGTYTSVHTQADLETWVAACRKAGRVAITVVPDRSDPMQAGLLGVGLSCEAQEAIYVPLAHEYLGVSTQLSLQHVRDVLTPLFADPDVAKVGHDVKTLAHLLRRHDMPVDRWTLDIMVAGFLLEPGRSSYPVSDLAHRFLGHALEAKATGRSGASATPPEQTPVEAATEETGKAVDLTFRLIDVLAERLETDGLGKVYADIDGPLLPLLAQMESNGIRVDVDVLATMSEAMAEQLDVCRGRIHQHAGTEFNVDSPKQLREVLFERLGLKAGRKTAKSKVASTNAEVLEELATKHEIARELLTYREISKLKSTYVDSLPKLVHPDTGRVHTSYHPAGAATGRLSSSDPNLQNIPKRTEAGRQIRSAFVADPGHLLVASDYSQIELRVLAHMCADKDMIAAFKSGTDIHRYTASKVFGVLPDLVTDAMRTRAKAVNFGILYGMSETRLAREQGMSRPDARKFIQAYFDRFPNVQTYIDDVRESATTHAEVRTLFGRVRRFPQLHGRVHRGLQEQALRAAVNTTLQGTAADLMKMAMLDVAAELQTRGLQARILLQVHDELLLETPESEVEATEEAVKQAMEAVHPLAVPLVVDQKRGRNWLEVS